jgi:capsule polysaccharide export protein KpsE/RkpR
MNRDDLKQPVAAPVADDEFEDEGPSVTLTEALTWIGEGKRLIAVTTVVVAIASIAVGLLLPKVYTAQATLLAPGSQQQSGSAAALAALGSLGGLAGGLGGGKTPDELYVALLKSDSVDRALAARFDLMTRYKADNFETLRKKIPQYVRVSSDKKSGLITVEVDDEDPKFAANLANAHAGEITKVLGRLAVSEAQLRRAFFEKQVDDTKEKLIKAEQNLLQVQQKSGLIVLDKQAEALITSASQVRALIADREVQLKVLRTSATDQNPDVLRLNSELRALHVELNRMESNPTAGTEGSAIDLPVGSLPAAGMDFVRARRDVKLQETLLEAMVRQYESAKLDEAKEGPELQQVDIAMPPDHKSKPKLSLIALGATLFALLASTAYVIGRRYAAWSREVDPDAAAARATMFKAWRWRS